MNNKQKGIILTVLALVSLVVITVGVTLAFFNYTKEGSTENSVTTGTITFLYTEVSGVGRGVKLTDAYPISDTVGKVQAGEGNVFDFKLTSTKPNKTSIPYEVTARKKSDSTLAESAVRMYLTKVTGGSEEEVLLDNYSNLTPTTKVSGYTEKTIYTGKIPANSNNYEQAFRLRMWIDEGTDFSPNEDGTYPYNGKTFTVTVNVYANAKVVTDEEVALESNTNISALSVGDNVLTKVEGQTYQYETTLVAGTTSTTINVETENEYATVSVEKIDSLAYQESIIQRLSTSKTLNLTSGDNYFKVTVTSENKKVTNEYKIKIIVAKDTDNTLKSLSLTNCPLNETFNKDTTSYTCTVENNAASTIISATTTSGVATIEGAKEYSLVTGDNTVTVTVTSESGSSKTYTIIVTKPVQEVKDKIIRLNSLIESEPTLTTSSNNTSDASGLYKSTATNDGSPTYYFRGNVTNNYVNFAGFTWRIIRINEDGTIRIMLENGINNNATYVFNSKYQSYTYMYYSSSSNAKSQLEAWYTTNIANNESYTSKVASGYYFCEQAKTKYASGYSSGNANMIVYSSYTPNFKCSKDGNGKGLVNASIGLITYDELVFAGGYYEKENSDYYLFNGTLFWTMSPAGFYNGDSLVWDVSDSGNLRRGILASGCLRAVINLKTDTVMTGTGTSTDPFVVQ